MAYNECELYDWYSFAVAGQDPIQFNVNDGALENVCVLYACWAIKVPVSQWVADRRVLFLPLSCRPVTYKHLSDHLNIFIDSSLQISISLFLFLVFSHYH